MTTDPSFKSLPQKLFSDISSEEPLSSKTGVLWLPPLNVHPTSSKIDWLTGMQISQLSFSRSKKWPENLREEIKRLNLPLDEEPPFQHKSTLIFSLPQGFKSSLGLIVTDSKWASREEVYNRYIHACDSFQTSDFFLQSLDFWTDPLIPNVEWIKA